MNTNKAQLIAIAQSKITQWVKEFTEYKEAGGTLEHSGLAKASAAHEIINEFRDDYPMGQTYRRIIADLVEREAMGFKKYGTTVDKAKLSNKQWMQHAYEEALDFAVYLKVLMSNYEERND
jgi:hypothetical protein